jgi:hypothetical protein
MGLQSRKATVPAPVASAAAPAKSIVKREPAVFATAAVTLIGTILYLAPSVGIEIPDNVAKIATLFFTIAAGFGIRSAVTPVKR